MDVTLEAIGAEISKQLEGVEGRLATHISDEISKHLTETEKRIDELKSQAAMHRESLRQDVIAAAEGYGTNLERIERELVELNKKFDTTFGDHDLVLANHNTRITKLEQR